jgi:hopanoid biosynthesis associated RND transporter like protein HpnN
VAEPTNSTHSERVFHICARLAIRRPGLTLIVALIVTAAAAYASTRMAVNTNHERLFAPDVEFNRNAHSYDRIFPREGSSILTVVDAPTADRARVAAADLAARLRASPLFQRVEAPGLEPFFTAAGLLFLPVEELAALREQIDNADVALAALSQHPDIRGIAEFLNLIATGLERGYEMPAPVTDLVSGLAETTRDIADSRSNTLSWTRLFPPGALQERGKRQFVLAYPATEDSSLQGAAPAIAAARQAARAVAEQQQDVKIRLTGKPVLDQQELDAALEGAVYASVLSFMLVALTLVLGIRSWRLILILICGLIIGTVWTTGLAAVAVRELNLISFAFGVLFFGVGIDFGTHLGLRYMERRGHGAAVGAAVAEAVADEGPAVLLSVICASVGFLSFLPTLYWGMAQLGIISALGMAVAFIVTIFLLPAIIALWPPKPATARAPGSPFAAFINRRAGTIVIVAALATLGAAALGTRARIDVNPLNLQDPDSEAVRVYRDLAADAATSPYGVNIAVADLEQARRLAESLKETPKIGQVRSIDSFIPDRQDEKRPIIEAIREVIEAPDDSALDGAALAAALDRLKDGAASLARAADAQPTLHSAAEHLSSALQDFENRHGRDPDRLHALDRALAGGLPPLLDPLRNAITSVTLDDLPAELRRAWLAPDGSARLEVLPAGDVSRDGGIEAFATTVRKAAPTATGLPILIIGAADVVRRSFLQAVIITAISIAVVIAFVRRRGSDVALVLTPLALASIWTVAAAALLDLPFNFANVIAIPVLLGVGVASSIHVVARARESARPGQGIRKRLLETSTPRAVFLTDANTALAFGTLAISSHRGLFSLGVLLALAITMSMLASLIVLPAILTVLDRRARAAG